MIVPQRIIEISSKFINNPGVEFHQYHALRNMASECCMLIQVHTFKWLSLSFIALYLNFTFFRDKIKPEQVTSGQVMTGDVTIIICGFSFVKLIFSRLIKEQKKMLCLPCRELYLNVIRDAG